MTAEEFARPLLICGKSFPVDKQRTVHLPVGHLITHKMVELTVHVRRGNKPGPRLLVTAAIHGDEINGVEVIRRLLMNKMPELAGDLILIPIVNLPAFLARSRYLPDRRDLNRLFPGSATGSFGARLAKLITKDIAQSCTHGIDLHTGAVNRPNLPQIRFCPGVPGIEEMAIAFGVPVMIHSESPPGSFREIFSALGKPQLMFEGGEAEIMEPASVSLALQGIISVMEHLQMLPPSNSTTPRSKPVLCRKTSWERAPRGGLLLPVMQLGEIVKRGMLLGEVGDPFSKKRTPIRATREGVIIGRTRNAVIDEGDGIFHIGDINESSSMQNNIDAAEAELDHSLNHQVFDDSKDVSMEDYSYSSN